MDTAFTHLLAMRVSPIRAEGKLYGLPHVFLSSRSSRSWRGPIYRAIHHGFIDVHLHRLKQTFGGRAARAGRSSL